MMARLMRQMQSKNKNKKMPRQKPKQKASIGRMAWAQGRRAEFFATLYLRLKFYRIMAGNLRLPGGEIDVVAKRGNLLVFIEVKYRPNRALAQAAITPRQWQRIEAAAAQFVAKRPLLHHCRWRFDLLAMAPKSWPLHRRNAWRSGGA
jgi:putative endonuclease